MLPFTTDAFFGVFEAYNRAIWPAQIAAYVVGAAMLVLALRGGPRARPVVLGGLALMWAVNGAAYHLWQFSAINPAAYGFGAVFILQAGLFAVAAAASETGFGFRGGWRDYTALVLIAYAAAVYPLLGWAAGHSYPASPMFGVAPCPTTIFTIGLLLLARGAPWWLWPVPVLWALIGSSAAVLLGVYEDLGLLAATLIALAAGLSGRAGNRGGSC